jgi:hypothetical protein
LNQLQIWGNKTLLNTKHNTPKIKRFSSSKPWPSDNKNSLNDFAKFVWGDHAFTITGAPARLVLIAPSFDKYCVELASYLRKRFVPIELICVDLLSNSKTEILMHFESILEQSPQIEPTWRAVRQLWQFSNIRNNFSANAWADHLNYASFSFSAQDSPQARFWLSVENHCAILSTVIPDGWCPGTALKNKVRASLIDALPAGFQIKDRVWLRQEFDLQQQEKEFLANAQALATVVRTVLAQHSPRAENKSI